MITLFYILAFVALVGFSLWIQRLVSGSSCKEGSVEWKLYQKRHD